MSRRSRMALAVLATAAFAACTSPEATRMRAGGPGADIGNHGRVVMMHEGSRSYWKTPRVSGITGAVARIGEPGGSSESRSLTTPTVGSPRAALAAGQPECEAWLRLYDEARAAFDDSAWVDAVPAPSDTTPFIDGAVIPVDSRAAPRLVQALLRRAGAPVPSDDDAVALLEAAIAEDDAALSAVAARTGIGHDIAAATGALATMPLTAPGEALSSGVDEPASPVDAVHLAALILKVPVPGPEKH